MTIAQKSKPKRVAIGMKGVNILLNIQPKLCIYYIYYCTTHSYFTPSIKPERSREGDIEGL